MTRERTHKQFSKSRFYKDRKLALEAAVKKAGFPSAERYFAERTHMTLKEMSLEIGYSYPSLKYVYHKIVEEKVVESEGVVDGKLGIDE